jgi:UDP-N-acetylmuramoylalanine--D-glutamate ligase
MPEPTPLTLTDRTVLVVGVGLAGTAAARVLLTRGARVLLADRQRPDAVEALVRAGADFLGDAPLVPDFVDLVWVSPGVAPSHPLVLSAQAAGIEIVGEAEFAWRMRSARAAPWLAVTGTNGKTTTVRMLESILRSAGQRALAVGNVGVSLLDAVVAELPYDALAVELSSFQLHWSASIAPAAGALLNIAPDHLDWHGSMSSYAAAKAKVWAGAVAIGNLDDPIVAGLMSGADSPAQGRRVGITLNAPGPGQFGLIGGSLVDRAFGPHALELLPAADVRPAGEHNVHNALAAAALARSAGVSPAAVAAGLRAFLPDPHRNEFVALRAGVRWVDDSKATNPHAAQASLESYQPVVWIAGGQLKDAPIEELVERVAGRLRAVVVLGADRATIQAALRRHAPDVPVFEVSRPDDGAMREVVAAAARAARPGDTVLLAPAAASYDMFSGYGARGDAFAAELAALGPDDHPAGR